MPRSCDPATLGFTDNTARAGCPGVRRMGRARNRSEVERGRAAGRQGSDAPLAVAP